MDASQSIQHRNARMTAVVKQVMPALSIGSIAAAGLFERLRALSARAQARDDALAASDTADNAE